MNGAHAIERCEEVAGAVLHAVFHALFEQGVSLESMLLKPSMVIAGKDWSRQASVQEVATATLRFLAPTRARSRARHRVPVGRPKGRLATAHLNAMNRLRGPSPGSSASPMGGRSRMRRWRDGTGGTRT